MWKSANIEEVKASTETFVVPSMSPAEISITSGFAPGWSGTIKYGISQEGFLYIQHNLAKTSNIGVYEVIYTMPAIYADFRGISSAPGINVTSIVANSSVSVVLEGDGTIVVSNHGASLAVNRPYPGVLIARKTVY